MFDGRQATGAYLMPVKPDVPSAWNLVGSLVGVALAIASFPQVWMALLAVVELSGSPAPGRHFLDFHTYPWARHASLLAHFWLGWALQGWRQRSPAEVRRAVAALVLSEVAAFWLAVLWLAVRGWGLPLL